MEFSAELSATDLKVFL